jgi:acetyl esterase
VADLDREIAALRDASAGGPALEHLTPSEARERVAAGNRLCNDGPAVSIDEPAGSPVPVRVYEGPVARATLVYAHGGGWVTGDLNYADEVCRHLAAEAAVRVVSVDYSLAPEHTRPAAVDDLATAWRWVAHRYPGSLALGGDSAGGNLAAVLAGELAGSEDTTPDFLLLLYPVLDLPRDRGSYINQAGGFPIGEREMRWFFRHYLGGVDVDPAGDVPERLVPLRAPVTGLPRTHLVLATHDPLHDEGADFAAQLREAGVPVTVRDHEDLCHGFLRLTAASKSARDARDELVATVARLIDDQTAAGTKARR